MGLVYKPFSIFAHGIAARLGKETFAAIWMRVGDGDRPAQPTAGRLNLFAVASAAALEAATMAATTAVIDQLTARVFHHLLGAWPQRPQAAEQVEPAVPAE
jgi:hypothetical protein